MKMLRNLLRGLIPSQKHLLYRLCILFITLYRFLLWYYNKVPLIYLLKELRNIQWKAVLWILEAFQMSSLFSIKAIADLVLIYLHLQKLSGRLQLRTQSLHLITSSNSCWSQDTQIPTTIIVYHLKINSQTAIEHQEFYCRC